MNTLSNTGLSNTGLSNAQEVKTFAENGLTYFKPYDSQLSIPEIENTRIVKCLYQVSPKTGKKIAENSYIRVPCDHITEDLIAERIAELAPYFVSYLQSVEDVIIKEAHKNGQTNFHIPSLGLDKILEVLEESEVSGRFTKEGLEAWFDKEIRENLETLVFVKMGLDENSNEADLHKLGVIINAYKVKFCSLASPKVVLKEEDCLALMNVIAKCDENESLVGKKLKVKLEGMNKKVEEVLMRL